ncbi:hypothetical protein LTR10_016278 [Elasticomyces elasticus]|uniref:Uncharacterized protein n=1 Tax=Exophiala sideris TaxID=1016849 RepID=A0ABR0JN20_9EURO|nr:hypothetical protein LTR10_016278 [Elasticomyces elasticus]KAK5037888.1 hypothetical protein LTS07_001355 [Exophiala sideris]KAK5043871.1 hypothetical protein LTR13_000225 [Exophiala sideris]KAK5067370.1 hypothetical protein LTR69_001357 [Exophiala sideris]KAK5182703.1 hypothetical protein LTR44_005094 [Eurotiomycetes sp. CCFEE 6388]
MTLFSGVAIITGAAGSGIGAATAAAFAEAGCKRIAITDRNAELLSKTHLSITDKWSAVEIYSEAGDISQEDFVTRFMANVVEKFGRVDYAVNCAGVLGQSKRSHEMDTAEFDRVNKINYRGCWLSSRAELRQMLKQDPMSDDTGRAPQRGAIVNIASQLGIVGRPTARVIETPMTTSDQFTRDRLAPAINIAPMGRMGKPQEIADSALFLCSNRASFIQGHALVVDGGYIIN